MNNTKLKDMRKLIFALLCGVLLSTNGYAVDTTAMGYDDAPAVITLGGDSELLVLEQAKTDNHLGEWVALISVLSLTILEIIFRAIPTARDISILSMLYRLFDFLAKNKGKQGRWTVYKTDED